VVDREGRPDAALETKIRGRSPRRGEEVGITGGAVRQRRSSREGCRAGGAIMIGFKYTRRKQDVRSRFQPIWLRSARGAGQAILDGTEKAPMVMTLKAKPGYAAGDLRPRGRRVRRLKPNLHEDHRRRANEGQLRGAAHRRDGGRGDTSAATASSIIGLHARSTTRGRSRRSARHPSDTPVSRRPRHPAEEAVGPSPRGGRELASGGARKPDGVR